MRRELSIDTQSPRRSLLLQAWGKNRLARNQALYVSRCKNIKFTTSYLYLNLSLNAPEESFSKKMPPRHISAWNSTLSDRLTTRQSVTSFLIMPNVEASRTCSLISQLRQIKRAEYLVSIFCFLTREASSIVIVVVDVCCLLLRPNGVISSPN